MLKRISLILLLAGASIANAGWFGNLVARSTARVAKPSIVVKPSIVEYPVATNPCEVEAFENAINDNISRKTKIANAFYSFRNYFTSGNAKQDVKSLARKADAALVKAGEAEIKTAKTTGLAIAFGTKNAVTGFGSNVKSEYSSFVGAGETRLKRGLRAGIFIVGSPFIIPTCETYRYINRDKSAE